MGWFNVTSGTEPTKPNRAPQKATDNFGAPNPCSGSAIQTADLVTQQPPLQTLSSPRARLVGFISPPGAEGLSVEARQTSPALREFPPGRERQAAAAVTFHAYGTEAQGVGE